LLELQAEQGSMKTPSTFMYVHAGLLSETCR